MAAEMFDLEKQTAREQLDRILAGSAFANADRISAFLRYVVEETLAGRSNRLSQHAIAIDVFGRDETFDPAVDSVIRVEAGRLRSKLRDYYGEEGVNDPIRLDLPKGTYAVRIAKSTDHVSKEQKAAADPIDGPVLAVLAFDNMSSDTEQEYFADGITEDLITELSKLSGLGVIARHSSFVFKGQKVSAKSVCEKLGATMVLEGSVRKSNDRVRITAQLIDGRSEKHLWAEKYDRRLDDIFEVQDDVCRKIVDALNMHLSAREQAQLGRKGTDVVSAYDYVLRGMKEDRAYTSAGTARAKYCYEKAIDLDPDYANAYARLSISTVYPWISGWPGSREETLDQAIKLARQAVQLDSERAIAQASLCWASLWNGDHESAIEAGEAAIRHGPNDVVALERVAFCLAWSGQPERGMQHVEMAKRLNPEESYNFVTGVCFYMDDHFGDAIGPLENSISLNPTFLPARLLLVVCNMALGLEQDAKRIAREALTFDPQFKADEERLPYRDPEDRKFYVDALERAGL